MAMVGDGSTPSERAAEKLATAKENDFIQSVLGQFLVGISPMDRIRTVHDIFLATTKEHNDEVALKWMMVYEDVVCRVYYNDKNFMTDVFPYWLKNLYTDLPITKASLLGPIPTLLKTKEWILKKIIVGWKPKRSALGYEIFRFFIELHKLVTYSYKLEIPKLIRERTGPEFTPEDLEGWMLEPDIPDEIMQVLAKAWVRNGGWKELPKLLKIKKYHRASQISL